MPVVRGKHFSYSPKGLAAARKAVKKSVKKRVKKAGK